MKVRLLFIALVVLFCPTPIVLGLLSTWLAWGAHRDDVAAVEEHRRAGWVDTEAVYGSCIDHDPAQVTHEVRYEWAGEWKDATGRTFPVQGRAPSCAPGMRQAIVANPANPTEYVLPAGPFLPVPLLLCFMGLGFSFIAVKEWRKGRRVEAERPPEPPRV